jgi:hypothetical protein
MAFNKQRRRPLAKGNQEVDLGNKEPIVGSPKPRARKLVRLQVVPCPYENRPTAAREPKKTQNGYKIKRSNPRAVPANKPFRKMNMNHIRSAQKTLLVMVRADLNVLPHYFAEEQQERRIISQLIRSRAHQDLEHLIMRALRNSALAIHLHILSGLEYVRMGSLINWLGK